MHLIIIIIIIIIIIAIIIRIRIVIIIIITRCSMRQTRETALLHVACGNPRDGATACMGVEYLYRRVASTHDLNAILFPPSSENTVRCIAV